MVILPKLDLLMTGTTILVPMLPKRPEIMLPHIELPVTLFHSGLKTILWMDPTEPFQEEKVNNQ
jgi:hypothetical protein